MKEKIESAPERESPHPSRFYECAERGHDPLWFTLVAARGAGIRVRGCQRCGVLYQEAEQKGRPAVFPWKEGDMLRDASEKHEPVPEPKEERW
jgi:hypothetical protein